MNTIFRTTLAVSLVLSSGAAFAQSIPFLDQTSLLPTTTYHSGNAIGVCDMNGDKKDDIVRSDNTTMSVCTWQASGNFLENTYAYNLNGPWGMCVGDVNNDGFNDVHWGNYGSALLMTWNGSGYTGSNVTALTSAGFIFVQGCNFQDIDNDGNLDMLICADTDMPHIYVGDGANNWTFNQSLIPMATVPASDNSGNYASIWSDVNNDGYMDMMITHCRQGVTNSSDPRRIDQVFINNGDYTYTQDVTNWTGLRDGAQGWSTTFGDIDNDGDMDAFVLNYDVNSKLLINNGSGVFTNAISGSGISNTTSFFGMNATFQDFDNDTYLDLLLTGDNHYLYKGNGNGTFSLVSPNPFPYSANTVTSHATGDLNGDGFLDVYGSYCDVYNSPSARNDHLWMNACPQNGNTNHYIFFDLVGGATPGYSNRNGIGAIVKIYGPWGVQVREVRSGEAYGIQNSFAVHFGLGANTAIDSVIVQWPSGIVDEMTTIPGDAHYVIPEGGHPTATGNINKHPFHMTMGPNPMSEQVTINLFNTELYADLNMQIIDVTGKVVYSQAKLSSNVVTVDKSVLAAGVYVVQVNNGRQLLDSQKLMVR